MIIANDNAPIENAGYQQRQELLELLKTSSYEGIGAQRMEIIICLYDLDQDNFDALKSNLLANQVGIDGAINPGQKEINNHLRKFCRP